MPEEHYFFYFFQAVSGHLNIHRVFITLESVGTVHKASPGRTTTAELLGQAVEALASPSDTFMTMAESGKQQHSNKV